LKFNSRRKWNFTHNLAFSATVKIEVSLESGLKSRRIESIGPCAFHFISGPKTAIPLIKDQKVSTGGESKKYKTTTESSTKDKNTFLRQTQTYRQKEGFCPRGVLE
jgi:hypothetical protein